MKIIIADDEQFARVILRSMLEELLGSSAQIWEARNGQVLVDLACEHHADAAFIDIKMPLMNGLEALEQIMLRSPDTHCVMVSGYGEFEYAQRALNTGAKSYLLKPAGMDKLAAIIAQIQEQLALRRKRLNNAFTTAILQSLMGGGDSWLPPPLQPSDDLKIHLFQYPFQAEQSLSLPDAVAHAVCRPHAEEETLAVACHCEQQQNLLTYILNAVPHAYHAQVNTLEEAAEISRKMNDCASLRTLLPPSVLFEGWQTADPSLVQLANALNIAFDGLKQQNKALWCSGMQQLESMRSTKAWKSADTCLWQERLRPFLTEAIPEDEPCDLLRWIDQAGNEMFQRSTSPKSTATLVQKILDYIQEHYCEDIGVDSVAEVFAITPNYLSSIFAQHTGTRFTNHLTDLRIERAKQLLKQSPQMRIQEIAEKVGFTSARYFSSVFTKKVGMLPSAYAKYASES